MINQSVQDFQNLIGGAVNAITGGTGSAGLIPSTEIPRMASGGIVSSATLALIGESGAEAVIPLDKMGDMGGGDTYVTVNVNGSVTSERNLVEAVRVGLLRAQKSGRATTI